LPQFQSNKRGGIKEGDKITRWGDFPKTEKGGGGGGGTHTKNRGKTWRRRWESLHLNKLAKHREKERDEDTHEVKTLKAPYGNTQVKN